MRSHRRGFGLIGAATAAVGLLVFAPAAAEASFARVYSGKLSRNTSLSTQQLTADPIETQNGVTTVAYDAALVSLEFNGNPAHPDSLKTVQTGFVVSTAEVLMRDVTTSDPPFYVTEGQFRDPNANWVEAGQVRLTFNRIDVSSPVIISELPGYDPYTFSPGYVQGDDLFSVIFYELPGQPGAANASYTIFTEPDKTLTYRDEEGTIVTVGGNEMTPAAVPEPAAAALGAFALAAGRSVMRRRASGTAGR
jgi:hypothetical protein